MPKGMKFLDLNKLHDGDGIRETMLKNNMKYHDSCKKKLSKDKLDKAKKRAAKHKANEAIQSVSPIKKIRSQLDTSLTETSKNMCFFYDPSHSQHCPGEVDPKDPSYHRASTKQLSEHVQNCAQTLRHASFLAKLVNSHMHALDAVYHIPCPTALYNEQHAFELQ